MKSKQILIKICKVLGVLIFWLAVWALISFRVSSELLFPSPISVLKALGALAVTSDFWISAMYSLVRVALGILISLIVGTLLAVLTEKIKILRALLSPILSVVKATPVASFIILALLWINRNTLPLFITALIVVPIVWSNVSEGLRSVDKNLVEVATVYRFSPTDKIRRLYAPSVAPFFMAACRSSLGLAWKAGVSAEVLSTPQNAIGTQLYFSKTYLETPSLFAWTAVVIILSIMFEKLFVSGIERLADKLHILTKGGQNGDKA